MDSNLIKHEVVSDMEYVLKCFIEKLEILYALDTETSESGSYDLYDQLKTLRVGHKTLSDCLHKSSQIIPRNMKEYAK
tara:strand:+ start:520 stop:753 length:234 start_codon:yes stop_codon:yes gene_type:complete